MNIILSVIAVLIMACSAFVILIKRNHGSLSIVRMWVPTCLIIGILLLTFSCSFVILPTGYTGVRTTMGQIDNVTVQSGFNWKIPFIQSIERVNNKQQDLHFDDVQVWSETNGRTAIFYEKITVTYQINPEKSYWIYGNVSDYKRNLVSFGIVSSAIKSSSKELSDTDATNRAIIEPLARQNLQSSIDGKYGEGVITINKVVIENIDFEESYNAAIAEKQQAQLNAERQAIENQKAIEKANADAEVKIANAKAAADAEMIVAKAEAEANEMIEKSLTDQILKEKYIEKWDGKLPEVMAGEKDTLIVS